MNFGELLHLQPENIKKQLRKIENLENKLANATVAIVFNKTCLNIYIYIYRVTRKKGGKSKLF